MATHVAQGIADQLRGVGIFYFAMFLLVILVRLVWAARSLHRWLLHRRKHR